MEAIISKLSFDKTTAPVINIDASGQIKINRAAAELMYMSDDHHYVYFLSWRSSLYLMPLDRSDYGFSFKKYENRSDTYICNNADLVRFMTRIVSVSPYKVHLPANANLYVSLLPDNYKGMAVYELLPHDPVHHTDLCVLSTQSTHNNVSVYKILGTDYTIAALKSAIATYANRATRSQTATARLRNKDKYNKMMQACKDHGIYADVLHITIK